jgi:hypothetical protein
MKKRFLIFFIACIMILAQAAYAQTSETASDDYFRSSIFYKGDLSISLDKEAYKAGEEIKADISAINMEAFPIADAYLVIELVSGDKKHVYPSMQSDVDKVFYEETIRNISFGPLSERTFQFKYNIPSDIKTGNYRVEAYLLTPRTPIIGIPHIFMAPKYRSILITGAGSFPGAYISRTATVFGSVPGPVGIGVNKSSYVVGTVFLKSDSDASLKGSKLNVTVCEWDDTSCIGGDAFLFAEYPVPEIPAGKTARVDVKFTSPKRPEAYSIKLELLDAANRLVSLYRSRIIVQGETGRIRKMAVDSAYYKKGQQGNITLLIGASPDHYTYPKVKNAILSVSLKNREGVIFSGESTIPELSIDANGGLLSYSYGFSAERDISEYTLCSRLESETRTLYDEYCYGVNSEETVSDEQSIYTEWSYNYDYGILDVKMCAEDSFGAPASSRASVLLMSFDDEKLIGTDENLSLAPCERVSYKVPLGVYDLVINDLENLRQNSYKVQVLPEGKTPNKEAVLAVCGDGKCDYSEGSGKCCVDCGCASGRNCVKGVCVKDAQAEVCGNGVCGAGEDSGNCCIDCDCPYGKMCGGDQCVTDTEAGQYSGNKVMSYVGIGFVVLGILIFFAGKKPSEKQKGSKNKLRGA